MPLLAGYRDMAGGRGTERRLTILVLVLVLLAVTALLFIPYTLWPRWPAAPVAANAPAMPIVVAGEPFHVPPRALRIAIQRPGPAGLALVAFRDGTPYQGEDLAFDPAAPEKFLARCSRSANPLTPATCLAERRIGNAELTVRFVRDWLDNWRDVEAGLDRLIGQLREPG